MSTKIKFETLAEAKDRLLAGIVTFLPTGEVTNIQGWDEDENGQALALVSLREGGGYASSTIFVELGMDEAIKILSQP